MGCKQPIDTNSWNQEYCDKPIKAHGYCEECLDHNIELYKIETAQLRRDLEKCQTRLDFLLTNEVIES